MKKLAVFETAKNRRWFRDNKQAFWRSKVFGKR